MSSWAAVVKAAAASSEEEKSLDLYSEDLEIAVVDATALIKGFSLSSLGKVIVSVQEVLNEVRDAHSRGWLQTLPCEIRALNPEPESVKTVVRFARDTGDLQFLSIADIKLIALTLQLEKALHGADHICTCPVIQSKVGSRYLRNQSVLPGWGDVSNPKDWEEIDKQNALELGIEGDRNPESRIRSVHPLNETSVAQELDSPGDDAIGDIGTDRMTDELQSVRQNDNDNDITQFAEEERDTVHQEDQDVQPWNNEESEHFDDWIHVSPKQRKGRRQSTGLHPEGNKEMTSNTSSRVCCLTSDFGIQNVLLQMGLNLITPDGVRIRHLSKFGLKCASCSKVTQGREKTFCFHCGNATLYKVRLEIGQNGMEVIGGLINPPQRRGGKCRIPPPKGGKKNTDAILSEDVMHQAMSQYRNMKHERITDVFGPEYNEDLWFKSRVVKNQLKDQLPGCFGYPRGMRKYVPHRRKRMFNRVQHVGVMSLLVIVFVCYFATCHAQEATEKHSHESHSTSSDPEILTTKERQIYDSLQFQNLLDRASVKEEVLNASQIRELMHLVSSGIFAEKPIDEALDGEELEFLFLTPDLILKEFGDGEDITRHEFRKSLPIILSCIAQKRCALITDVDFVDHDHDDHSGDDGDHKDPDHKASTKTKVDNEEHDHDDHTEEHTDHDDHDKETPVESEGSDEHDHDEHEDSDHENHDHPDSDESHDAALHAHPSTLIADFDDHDHGDHDHGDHDHDDDKDDPFEVKIIALSVLFAESIVASMLPIVVGTFQGFDSALSFLNCFAGGTLLGTGLIHLMPHVIEYEDEVDGIGEYPVGLLVVTLSFSLVFYVEHILVDVHAHSDTATPLSEGTKREISLWMHMHDLKQSIVLLAATSIHSILEALVLGLEDDTYTVWLLFASIAAHKGVTAMAMAARFTSAYVTTRQALGLSAIFSLTAPIGVLIGTGLTDVPPLTNLILTAMSTGTFLYIGAYEVISDEFHNDGNKREDENEQLAGLVRRHLKYLATLAGVGALALAAFIPHADHGDHDGHNH